MQNSASIRPSLATNEDLQHSLSCWSNEKLRSSCSRIKMSVTQNIFRIMNGAETCRQKSHLMTSSKIKSEIVTKKSLRKEGPTVFYHPLLAKQAEEIKSMRESECVWVHVRVHVCKERVSLFGRAYVRVSVWESRCRCISVRVCMGERKSVKLCL